MDSSGQYRSDVRYEFHSFLGDKGNHAGRLAVLYPLAVIKGGGGKDQLIQGGVKALGSWRRRLLEWGNVGWKFAGSGASVVRMRNCPPAFFATSRSGGNAEVVPCARAGVCPWCFGRRVVTLYHTVAGNVTNGGEQLVSAFGKRILEGPKSLAQAMEGARDVLAKLFRANSYGSGGLGGWYSVTAFPRGGDWVVRSSLLALLPMDDSFDLVPGGWKQKRWDRPTPDDVVTAVSRAARYPAALLRGDAARAAEVVKAMEGLKLSNYIGRFRGEEAEKRAKVSESPAVPRNKPSPKPPPPEPAPYKRRPKCVTTDFALTEEMRVTLLALEDKEEAERAAKKKELEKGGLNLNVLELLVALDDEGFRHLYACEGQLVVFGDLDRMPPDLALQVRLNKPELLASLKKISRADLDALLASLRRGR